MSFTGRVLHVCKYWAPFHGGVERFVEDLVREQRRQGIEAFALAHHPPGFPLPTDDPPWLRRVPVTREVAFVPIAPALRRELARAIAEFKPDYLHWHMPNMAPLAGLTLASARRLPWVIHWHSDVVASKHQRLLRWLYPFYRPYERLVLERAHLVIATSASYLVTSEALEPYRDRTVAIPLGLEYPDRQPNADELAWAASQWPEGQFRLLAIGRLTYYKGFDTLIRALAPLEDVALVLVGDGKEGPKLRRLIAQIPGGDVRIRLLSRVTEHEKLALLHTAQAFALPSRERTEAFGLVLVEAMRAGLPIIASRLEGSGVRELAREGLTALTPPPDEVPAWTASIERLARDAALAAALGQNGRRLASERFEIESVTKRLERIVQAVLDPDHPQPEAHERPLVVIPAYNEEATVGEVVADVKAHGYPDVVVVDDASTDATAERARAAGAIVLRLPLRLGAWGATQTGIRYALRHNYSAVITMDADGQHFASEIQKLLDAAGGVDAVIGSCPARATRLRRLAWAWFRWITGLRVLDFTSGFRLYRRTALATLAGRRACLLEHQDVGVLHLLAAHRLMVREVSVRMGPRRVGGSRVFSNWGEVARYFSQTTLLAACKRGHKLRSLAVPVDAWS
ncbi:MAG: glycosyltransferase [Casimicrobiaceae bacterium]|nr:glycosyltransferase [Casimicrobiaceae bacterium]